MMGHIFFSRLSAIPAIVRMGEIACGKFFAVHEDEAAAHVAPHDQCLAVGGGELGIELEQ